MPLPVIPNTFRVTLNWTRPGLTAHNVIHVRGSAATTYADVLANLEAAANQDMWDAQGTGSSIDSITILELDGTSAGAEFATSPGTKWVGGAAETGAMIPICQIVRLRTGLQGRRNRGRVFLPWVDEQTYANGGISSSVFNTVTTGWEAFRVSLATALTPLVVASYAGATANNVTSCLALSKTGTVRRRTDQIK